MPALLLLILQMFFVVFFVDNVDLQPVIVVDLKFLVVVLYLQLVSSVRLIVTALPVVGVLQLLMKEL